MCSTVSKQFPNTFLEELPTWWLRNDISISTNIDQHQPGDSMQMFPISKNLEFLKSKPCPWNAMNAMFIMFRVWGNGVYSRVLVCFDAWAIFHSNFPREFTENVQFKSPKDARTRPGEAEDCFSRACIFDIFSAVLIGPLCPKSCWREPSWERGGSGRAIDEEWHAMLEDQSIESENLNEDDGFLGPNIGIGKVSKSSFHNIWRISPTLDFDLYLYVCAADCLCLTPLRDEQWSEHLEYVPHFFKHPQCVLIRGCPVFFAYRIGHMKAQASPMLELWYKLAPQNGFSGMETRGGFQHVDGPTLHPHIKGGFHFGPSFCYNRWANHWREAAGGWQVLYLLRPRCGKLWWFTEIAFEWASAGLHCYIEYWGK